MYLLASFNLLLYSNETAELQIQRHHRLLNSKDRRVARSWHWLWITLLQGGLFFTYKRVSFLHLNNILTICETKSIYRFSVKWLNHQYPFLIWKLTISQLMGSQWCQAWRGRGTDVSWYALTGLEGKYVLNPCPKCFMFISLCSNVLEAMLDVFLSLCS